MKKRSTRQRIAWSMALLTGSVVLVVVVVLNILMITNMYRGERRTLWVNQRNQVTNLWRRTPRTISLTAQEWFVLEQWRVWKNLAKIEWERYIFESTWQEIVARQITEQIERQIKMLRLSLLVVLLASGLGFGIARRLTKRLLTDIETLQDFVEWRTLANLQESLSMDHLPVDDTITRLTDSVNTANHLLLEKIQTIKQFALYAAHELKSPVMSMQSSIELALKTQNYHKYMTRVQDTVNGMQWTIETLLMTVDIHRVDQVSERILIKNLITSLCGEADHTFGIKSMKLVWEPTVIIETSRGVLTTVLSNLIDNAWKYHEWEDTIRISRSSNEVVIVNSSSSLQESDLDSLWIPFWQLKTWSTDWQWLGLSLVQSVADHMGWKVNITLGKENTVRTTVSFT